MSVLPNLDHLPSDILHSARALVWKYETREGTPKPTKVPYIPHRPARKAAVDDATTWGPFATAYNTVQDGKADGVGIMLGEGLVGLDLDNCRDAETGVITHEAQALIEEINSYTELSPSRTGVHIFAHGALPPGRRVKKNDGLEIEMYADLKYFTVTGAHVAGTPLVIHDRTDELVALHRRVFGVAPVPPPTSEASTSPLSDSEVLALAMRARNGDRVAQLWSGDTSRYSGDDSAADLALCNALAFYTQDADQIDRLFRSSGLMREKWDSRRNQSTYGSDTIARALRDIRETYTPPADPIELELDDAVETDADVVSNQIAASAWPTLSDDALIGPFGDFVRAVSPTTEADPVGVLAHALVLFGNLVGRGPQVAVGEDLHHVNENILIVGDTSTGRKGMALNTAKALMGDVDPDWMTTRLMSGLSSGEGLIYAVRDPQTSSEGEIIDTGVADKRLVAVETEFAKVLRVSRRENNTLSTILRQAWDDGTLRVMTRNNPLTATGAHVSIVGHITPLELRQELKTTDMASGFVNRFLVLCVKRRHLLPDGGRLDDRVRAPLVAAFRAAAQAAQDVGILARDVDAQAHWSQIYGHLTRSRLGLVGAICNRAPAHVLRLSAIYALADQSPTIQRRHQLAALAVWDYAEASAMLIFGQRVGHRLANFLLELMRSTPTGVTRTEIRDALGRHGRADEISEALQLLNDLGLATLTKEMGPGRPTARWVATTAT
jgi:hypothetical protein